ncbi:hypothetical protein CIB84_003568 [Bambusicola thoracicus]|uniref:Uncharacterized protein n=1 Tax=Bambusicola thoracicus TaxID=9083 RepID=A0A2P4T8J7_BAMTH|nr:hypothetical protein CIB84_003568 [Bambusicola thoracicus]
MHNICYLLQAISFLTPLAVIFVVKIIRRTDKTEIKEAFLGNVCHISRWKVCDSSQRLIPVVV